MTKKTRTNEGGVTWRDMAKAFLLSAVYGLVGLAFFQGFGSALQMIA